MRTKSVIRTLAILLGCFGLLLGTVLIVLALATQTPSFRGWLKGVLVRQTRQRLGLSLSVGKVSGNLVSGLILQEVELAGQNEERLSLEELKIRILSASLLAGRIIFPLLSISKPHLTIIRTEDGAWRILPLPPFPKSRDKSPLSISDLRIKQLLIQDGVLIFRDYFQRESPREICGQNIWADLSLRLNLQAEGRGRWESKVRDLSLLLVSPSQMKIKRIQADLSYQTGELALGSLEIMTAQSCAWLSGRLSLPAGPQTEPSFDLRAKFPQISLLELKDILAKNSQAQNSQAEKLSASLLRLSGLKGEGRVRGRLSDLDYTFLLAFEAEGHKGKWQSSGNLDLSDPQNPRYRLQSRWRKLPLILWLPAKYRSDFPHFLDLWVRIKGEGLRWDEISSEIEADLSPCTLFGQPDSAVKFSGLMSGRSLQIEKLEVISPAGRARIEGQMDLRPPFIYQANLSFQQVNLERIRPLSSASRALANRPQWALASRLAGEASLQGMLGKGFPKNFQAAGSIRLLPSWVGSRFLDTLLLQGDFEAGRLHLSQGKVVMDGAAFSVRGTASRQRLYLVWNLSELDLALTMPERLANFPAGVLSGQGKITGSLQSPEIEADLAGRDLTYRGYRASNIVLKGKFSGIRAFQSLNFDAQLKASSIWHDEQKLQDSLKLKAQKEKTAIRWQIEGTQGANRIWRAKGSAEIFRPWQVSARLDEFSFPLEGVIWQNLEPIRIELDADKTLNAVRILSLRLGAGPRYLTVRGEISRGGQQKMQIQILGFPLQEIWQWSGRANSPLGSLSGTLEGEALLAGTLADPQIEGKLEITDGRWSAFSFRRLRQLFSYRQKSLDITATLSQTLTPAKTEKETIHLEGRVPIDLSFRSVADRWSWPGIELRGKFQEVDLSSIPSLLPVFAEVKGAVSGTGAVSGSLRDPRFEVAVGFVKTSFRIRQLAQVFQVKSALITGNSQRISFENVELAGKSGIGKLSGSLELAGFSVKSFTTKVRAQKWEIAYSRHTYFVLNGDLLAQGKPEQISLTGKISVAEGKIKLSDFAFGKQQSPEIQIIREAEDEMKLVEQKPAFFKPRVAMNITVSIPRNLWVIEEQTNIELKGELGIHKSYGQDPAISGRIESVRGTYKFYGKEFIIRRALIQFQGLPEINPLLDMETVYRIRETNIYILITGTRKAPLVRLQSDDKSLSQDKIISLLVFGQPLENLNQREAASLQGEAFALLGRVVATQVLGIFGEKLPVDTVQIRASKEGTSTLEVGKYLTRNIFVSFGKEFGQEKGSEQIVVEYYLYSNLTLAAEIRSDQNSSVDLIWKKDF